MRRQRSLAELDAEVLRWNAQHKTGTEVIYHPVIGEKAGKRTRTRSAAFVLSGHTACVFVEGVSGCVALEAIEVI